MEAALQGAVLLKNEGHMFPGWAGAARLGKALTVSCQGCHSPWNSGLLFSALCEMPHGAFLAIMRQGLWGLGGA